jgi:rhodanese-related sulfurtransferase
VLRRALAIVAMTAGVLAAVSGSPYRRDRASIDVAQLARAVAAEEDHVTALELAQWIRDRKAGLRIIDLRSANDFAMFHLPRAERVPMEAITSMPFTPSETIVLISDGGAHAAQAWVFLRALGHPHVFFLRGGVGEWLGEVMNPKAPSDLTRYFGGMPRSDEETLSIDAMRRRGC